MSEVSLYQVQVSFIIQRADTKEFWNDHSQSWVRYLNKASEFTGDQFEMNEDTNFCNTASFGRSSYQDTIKYIRSIYKGYSIEFNVIKKRVETNYELKEVPEPTDN